MSIGNTIPWNDMKLVTNLAQSLILIYLKNIGKILEYIIIFVNPNLLLFIRIVNRYQKIIKSKASNKQGQR